MWERQARAWERDAGECEREATTGKLFEDQTPSCSSKKRLVRLRTGVFSPTPRGEWFVTRDRVIASRALGWGGGHALGGGTPFTTSL